MSAYVSGQLEKWPILDRMAAILSDAGLHIVVGHYSIRIEDFDHFVFQEYGGDLGDPQIDADADTLEATPSAVIVNLAFTCPISEPRPE